MRLIVIVYIIKHSVYVTTEDDYTREYRDKYGIK